MGIDVNDRLATLEAGMAELRAKDGMWHAVTRYARGIDEHDQSALEDVFTHDAVSQTIPWTDRLLEGRELVLKASRNYQATFKHPRRFITNEQFALVEATEGTGWANWFVVQARAGESYYGWGTYDWSFRLEDATWRISRMIITVECMTTLERGWSEAVARVMDFPTRD
jgi:hypothetical protein